MIEGPNTKQRLTLSSKHRFAAHAATEYEGEKSFKKLPATDDTLLILAHDSIDLLAHRSSLCAHNAGHQARLEAGATQERTL